MAKPTGGVTVGALYYDHLEISTSTAEQIAYFAFRAPLMPADWETDNQQGKLMSYKIYRQVYIDDPGQTLFESWKCGESEAVAFAGGFVETDGTTPALESHLSDTQSYRPDGIELSKSPGASGEKVKYIVPQARFWCDSTADEVRIYSVSFVGNLSYSSGPVEMLQRTSNRLYGPDMPCSSWHVKKALKETHKKILSETIPAFTVPVFGYFNIPIG